MQSLTEHHTIITGGLTETHLVTTVLETFRASSHQQPSTSLCDWLADYNLFPGSDRPQRHGIPTTSCNTHSYHKPPPRAPDWQNQAAGIWRFCTCRLPPAGLSHCRDGNNDVCRSAQARSAQDESARMEQPQPSPATQGFPKAPRRSMLKVYTRLWWQQRIITNRGVPGSRNNSEFQAAASCRNSASLVFGLWILASRPLSLLVP